MNSEEINKLMAESSGDAVQFAKEELGLELDRSLESIRLLDELLIGSLPLLKEEDTREKYIFTICNIVGAYMGEVFKENIGGTWVYDDTDPEAPATMLAFNDKTFAFPGICYQKLVNDQAVSVSKYFELATSKVTQ